MSNNITKEIIPITIGSEYGNEYTTFVKILPYHLLYKYKRYSRKAWKDCDGSFSERLCDIKIGFIPNMINGNKTYTINFGDESIEILVPLFMYVDDSLCHLIAIIPNSKQPIKNDGNNNNNDGNNNNNDDEEYNHNDTIYYKIVEWFKENIFDPKKEQYRYFKYYSIIFAYNGGTLYVYIKHYRLDIKYQPCKEIESKITIFNSDDDFNKLIDHIVNMITGKESPYKFGEIEYDSDDDSYDDSYGDSDDDSDGDSDYDSDDDSYGDSDDIDQ